jgi:hypothetical protein
MLLNNHADAIEDLTARLNRMALHNDVSLIESHVDLVKHPPDDHKTLYSVPVVVRISRVLVQVKDLRYGFPSAIDDGADVTVVGINAWEHISKANPNIEPAGISFTLADGSNIYVKFTALLDLHIMTIARPVVDRRHRVHVADKAMPDVLLRCPLLLCLGIDIEEADL